MKSYPLKSAVWMIGAMISFILMAISGRELAIRLNTFEIMLYRSIIGLVVVLFFASIFDTFRQIKIDRIILHFFRNLSHFTGQNLWFLAVVSIPFSQLFALEFSTPIWVALLAPIFLRESLTYRRTISVLIGFVGILIVARPDFRDFNFMVIAATACAFFFAGSMMATKKLTQDQSITCILFWLTTMQLGMGMITVIYIGDLVVPSGANWFWVVAVGIGGLLAHFCITKALALAPAIVVIPLDFMRLPLISVIGFFYYGEMFEWPILVGAIIILFATFFNLQAEQKSQKG